MPLASVAPSAALDASADGVWWLSTIRGKCADKQKAIVFVELAERLRPGHRSPAIIPHTPLRLQCRRHFIVIACGVDSDQTLTSGEEDIRKVLIGMIDLAVLFCAGLVSNGAKAAPPVATLKRQSLVEEVSWRCARERRPLVRRSAVGLSCCPPPRPPRVAACDASSALVETN